MMASSGDLITLIHWLRTVIDFFLYFSGNSKDNLKSNESAMKYVINGGISTAITLVWDELCVWINRHNQS